MRIGLATCFAVCLGLCSPLHAAEFFPPGGSQCYRAHCVQTTNLRGCYLCCGSKCDADGDEFFDCKESCKVKDHAYAVLGDDQSAIANFLGNFGYSNLVSDLDYCFLVGDSENAEFAAIIAGDVYQVNYAACTPEDRDWLKTIVVGAMADPRSEAIRTAACAAWRQAVPQDVNQDGNVNVSDIFAFLRSWFAGAGDFDHNGFCNVSDIFGFLRGWFRGCAPQPLPVAFSALSTPAP